jgi:serine/threonine protein kinase
VAIKIIEKSNIKTTKQKISVDREVRLMKLLNHPHIVGVLDVFESKDFIWIIMENAPGGELFELIVKNGMIKEPEARDFFRQILSALEYCHMVISIPLVSIL